MESLYLRGHAIQEVGGKMIIGSSIYGVAVIDGSLCSRVYGIYPQPYPNKVCKNPYNIYITLSVS